LKKRSKKLLRVWAEPLRKSRSQIGKSFLLLFFKKEVLATLLQNPKIARHRNGLRPTAYVEGAE
jgi:hypothetical protein